jgi:hypothetical protein
MRAALAASTEATAQARADVDLYLAVPLALLTGQTVAPVAGASSATINGLVQAAVSATGIQSNTLFGVDRDIDMSQFKPRGHYTDTPELGQYFRAMMWLGRIEFRLIETQSDGSQVFYRRQTDAMLLLSDLLGPGGLVIWNRIEAVIRKFVGDADNMTPAQVPSLMSALGITSLADGARIDDATMAQAIITGGFGAQRIASQLIVNYGVPTLPLNRSFLIFGQRYVVDSHVFSNLVYDRVGKGTIMRMMPNPLDIAYAALGNDDALALLGDELAKYPYAPDLEAMRILVDEHGADYWDSTLYTGWLGALRALSPAVGGTTPAGSELPSIALTEGWGRRLTNTQLPGPSCATTPSCTPSSRTPRGWCASSPTPTWIHILSCSAACSALPSRGAGWLTWPRRQARRIWRAGFSPTSTPWPARPACCPTWQRKS